MVKKSSTEELLACPCLGSIERNERIAQTCRKRHVKLLNRILALSQIQPVNALGLAKTGADKEVKSTACAESILVAEKYASIVERPFPPNKG